MKEELFDLLREWWNDSLIRTAVGFIVLVALMFFIFFTYCDNKVEGSVPKAWVCWVNSVEDSQCGTYGISKNKSVAYEFAHDKCIVECNSNCQLEYCEVK